MRGSQKDLPVIVVGGAACLLSNQASSFLITANYNVANAYGAALADISATLDTVVSLENRNQVLEKLKEDTFQLALNKGSDPTKTSIVDVTIMPYHYMSNQLARVIIKASGPRNWS